MMTVQRRLFIAFCLLLGVSIPAFAGADMFIKIEGIDGESKDSKHEKWIDVLSIDWGSKSRAQDYNSSRSNNTSSKANHNTTRSNRTKSAPVAGSNGHVTVLKRVDKSSPLLAKAVVDPSSKKSAPDSFFDVFVDVIAEDGSSTQYQLVEVRVNRIEMARTADGVPTEMISMSYRSMKPVGATNRPAGWDGTYKGKSAKRDTVERDAASGMATGKRQH